MKLINRNTFSHYSKSTGASSLAAPLLKSLLTEQSKASSSNSATPPQPSAFPPGLLAANPDLAKAVPGSLLVVRISPAFSFESY